MDSLPDEIIFVILKNVPLWEYKQLAASCSILNNNLHDDNLWQSICENYEIEPKDNDYLGSIKRALKGEWVGSILPDVSNKGSVKCKNNSSHLYKCEFNKLNSTLRIKINSEETDLNINLSANRLIYTYSLVRIGARKIEISDTDFFKAYLNQMDEICIRNIHQKIQIFYNQKLIEEYHRSYFSMFPFIPRIELFLHQGHIQLM